MVQNKEVRVSSIKEILKDLGVEDANLEKNATISNERDLEEKSNKENEISIATETEKTAATINKEGDSKMDLQDFYNEYFEADLDDTYTEKTAAAVENHELGELAGQFFNEKVASVLEEVVMQKLAEEGNGDSAASIDAQKGPGLIPSGNVVDNDVNLPKNVAPNAAAPINTDPQYYDLLDAAVAKKKVEKAIENAEIPAELDHRTVQVDTGLEMPAKQDV